MVRSTFKTITAAVAIVALAAPLSVQASSTHAKKTTTHRTHTLTTKTAGTAIQFGVQGGNMRPWTVTIDVTGAVASKPDGYPVASHHLQDPKDTLNGLVTLANAGGFFTMTASTQCTGTLPDISSRFVTINTTTGATTVRLHGGCNSQFNELFAVLSASAGLSNA